eukprot:628487-Amphidinium_carterae.1
MTILRSRTVVARSEEAERLRNELSLALVHLTRLESETASSAALHAGLEVVREPALQDPSSPKQTSRTNHAI